MAIFSAMKEGYLLAEIDGRSVLFTSMRLDRDTVPEWLFCYDIQDSVRLDGNFTAIKPFVEENHLGTILCKEPFPLDETGSYIPKNWGLTRGMTIEEFRRNSVVQATA